MAVPVGALTGKAITMLDPGNPNYRLQDLEQRWAVDPDSRIYQQLAEEYRLAGRLEKAAEVLEDGISRRPRDVGGHVALGRCRLALGKTAEAVKALDQVVALDPAHHVANKLLIEAHLQAGDARRAGERLEIYGLLNDRDPEIEHFTFRLGQLREQADVTPKGEVEVASPEALEVSPREDDAAAPQDNGAEAAAQDGHDTADETLPLAMSIEALAASAREKSGFASSGPTAPEGSEVTEAMQMADQPSPPPSGDIFSLQAPPEAPAVGSLWQQVAPPNQSSADEPFGALLGRPVESSAGVPGQADDPFPQVMALPTRDEAVAPAAETVEPAPTAPTPAEPMAAELAVGAEVAVVEEPEPGEPMAAVAEPEVAVVEEPVALAEPEPVAFAEAEPEVVIEPEPVALAEPEPAIEAASEAVIEAEPVAEEDTATDAPLETGIAPSLLRRRIDELAPTQPLPALTDEPAVVEVEASSGEMAVAETTEAAPVAESPFPGLSVPGVEVEQPEEATVAADVAAEAPSIEDTDSIELMETSPVLPAIGFDAVPVTEEAPVGMVSQPELGAETEDDEPVATVTLGNLYLRQGHFDEAAKIFEQVLAHEPDNSAAQQGLAAARPQTEAAGVEPAPMPEPVAVAVEPEPVSESPAMPESAAVESEPVPESAVAGEDAASRVELTAAKLLADRSLAGTIPDGKTAKTVLVLSNYLKQLKTARERHDVQ